MPFPAIPSQIRCPNCGTPFLVDVRTVIDVGQEPELKELFLRGELNHAECPQCHTGGLLNTPLITDIVRKGEVHRLKEVMTKSTELGMQTFDQALFALFCAGQIGYSEALAHADSANDLRLLIKLSGREQLGAGTLDNVTLDE